MNPHLHIHPDPARTSRAAAEFLVGAAKTAIGKKGRFILSLAGGSTPRSLYELLAGPPFREAVDWQKAHVIWGDERCVPETSEDSNSRMAKAAWLDGSLIPASQLYPIDGTLTPLEGAARYEARLKELFDGDIAAIDLCLLGMGDDGHTASLFPHTEVLAEEKKWVSAVYVEKMQSWRVTLTAPVIRSSARIAFLVSGAKKAAVLPKVLRGDYQPEEYPSQLVLRDHPNAHLFLDTAAAKMLS